MNSEEITGKDGNPTETPASELSEYGEQFEMGEELKFEEACKSCKEKLYALDTEYRMAKKPSSFEEAFNGFARACKEKSKECVETAVDRVLELAKEDDPEVAPIARTGRAGITGGRWGSRGEMGTGEFVYEALGSICLPQNVGRLETMSKTMPSSDFNRFENMRMDAYRIEMVVIGGRSFIHDCAPEAYRLISAMVDYYDAKDDPEAVEAKREELEATLTELREEHGSGYTDPHERYVFDLENYDKPASAYDGDGVGGFSAKKGKDRRINPETGESELIYDGETEGEVKAIDILRRLKKNMEPVPLEAPKTKIPELNEAFERLGTVAVDEKTGEIKVSLSELADVVRIANAHLAENQGQRTLFPSTIAAIAYIDKLSAAAVKGMSKKDWEEAAFDPTFKEVVRFSQLTMSGGYSEEEFEGFYSRFREKAGAAYGEDGVDDEMISEACHMLSSRALNNAKAVASEFSDNPRLKYLSKAVWSGNLTHELVGIFEK